ncbi:MAG: helix-turn-helix domain-containing protein [Spirochaetia bacterium]
MDNKVVWQRINSLIKAQNKTQAGLSMNCGFTERRISSLSTANRLPDALEIVLIARALGTTVEYLVTGTESSPCEQKLKALLQTLEQASKDAKT